MPAEYSLEDSDLEGLSDITVSSVHTSDLSSFDEDSDEEQPPSESSEEGELQSDGLQFHSCVCFHFHAFHVFSFSHGSLLEILPPRNSALAFTCHPQATNLQNDPS